MSEPSDQSFSELAKADLQSWAERLTRIGHDGQSEAVRNATDVAAAFPEAAKAYDLEKLQLERDSARLAHDVAIFQHKDDVQRAADRRKYAGRLFRVTCLWIFAVLAIVVCDGVTPDAVKEDGQAHTWYRYFEVSDAVLIALISGVSVGVIGLFAAVLGWLFPKG